MAQFGHVSAATAAVSSGHSRNSQLTLNSTSLNFGNVALSTTKTQDLILTSTGTTSLKVNSAKVSGTGYQVVSQVFPVTLKPKQSMKLQVQFNPAGAGAAAGQLTISSDSASGGTVAVALRATGTVPISQLSLSTSALSFGTVALDVAATQTLTLGSTGDAPVVVNSVAITGPGFTTVGGAFPITLNPGQTAALQVQFRAAAAGAAAGQLRITSNSASGSLASVALSGTGQAAAHEIDLNWSSPSSSSDAVTGYNIYRSTGTAAFVMVSSSKGISTAYVDSTVSGGTSYKYVVKSVDASSVESVASNEFQVTIP